MLPAPRAHAGTDDDDGRSLERNKRTLDWASCVGGVENCCRRVWSTELRAPDEVAEPAQLQRWPRRPLLPLVATSTPLGRDRAGPSVRLLRVVEGGRLDSHNAGEALPVRQHALTGYEGFLHPVLP